MNANLLPNRELANYASEDSFNFQAKGDALRLFLEHNFEALEKNKMLVLYGGWGSGKTSLMRHIENTIDKNIYFPIFFEAWEHEKDENLPLSLCDSLITQVDGNNDTVKEFIKGALNTLKSFASGITLKAPGYLTGLGLDLEISGDKYVKALEDALNRNERPSFYKSNQEFKESFLKVENILLEQTKATKILIFIDDLDRCEPENVLNLITALKLFFTYGKNCVFLCGIDKDAVTKAVRTRYKDVIKSEEYMEKVFDIAFSMPKTFSIKNLLKPHFLDFEVRFNDDTRFRSTNLIEEFFKSIKFTNPRHLKKVLNKYEILKTFKQSDNLPRNINDLIPSLITTNNQGKVFETIYALFAIILYEYYPEEFDDISDYKKKMIKYTEVLYATKKTSPTVNFTKGEASIEINTNMAIPSIESAHFGKIMLLSQIGVQHGSSKYLYIFSNSNPTSLSYMSDNELYKYNTFFPDDQISTNFCKFLLRHINSISEESSNSPYVIFNIFSMAKYLL